jgi:hypothetical protein
MGVTSWTLVDLGWTHRPAWTRQHLPSFVPNAQPTDGYICGGSFLGLCTWIVTWISSLFQRSVIEDGTANDGSSLLEEAETTPYLHLLRLWTDLLHLLHRHWSTLLGVPTSYLLYEDLADCQLLGDALNTPRNTHLSRVSVTKLHPRAQD